LPRTRIVEILQAFADRGLTLEPLFTRSDLPIDDA